MLLGRSVTCDAPVRDLYAPRGAASTCPWSERPGWRVRRPIVRSLRPILADVGEVDERPTKTCPDCAETVLAAARKCRFCGYRFDGAAPEAGSENGLRALILRRPPRSTVPAVVARWGVEVADDEQVVEFKIADIDGAVGWVLVTSARVALFHQSGHQCTLVGDVPLRALQRVDIARGGVRRALRLQWASGAATISGLNRAELARLQGLLSADTADASPGPSTPNVRDSR